MSPVHSICQRGSGDSADRRASENSLTAFIVDEARIMMIKVWCVWDQNLHWGWMVADMTGTSIYPSHVYILKSDFQRCTFSCIQFFIWRNSYRGSHDRDIYLSSVIFAPCQCVSPSPLRREDIYRLRRNYARSLHLVYSHLRRVASLHVPRHHCISSKCDWVRRGKCDSKSRLHTEIWFPALHGFGFSWIQFFITPYICGEIHIAGHYRRW
jgi:hypothetical protein